VADPRRFRRALAVLLVLAAVVVTIASTLTGDDSAADPGSRVLDLAAPLVTGRPVPQVLARQDSVTLVVPIGQDALTGIAYHAVEGSRAADLVPVGEQANAGLLDRVIGSLFGDDGDGLRYWVADDSTQAVDVGAAAGTEVYSPTTGVVVAITPYLLSGRKRGDIVGIQPYGNPSVVVNVAHIDLRTRANGTPAIEVGDRVVGGTTLLGTVVDLEGVVETGLSRFVSDAGNNASITVEPAPALQTP
jgi:hypothetical protein